MTLNSPEQLTAREHIPVKDVPNFSLPGGFIKFTNPILTLHPDRIHVEADLSISQLADAHFSGDLYADGTYELSAKANLQYRWL